MSYASELKKILDKSSLTDEERRAFEDFVDGKTLRNLPAEAYPDRDVDLRIAVTKNSILKTAQSKLHKEKLWGEIIAIHYKYMER